MNLRWIPLGILTVIAVASLAFREQPPAEGGTPINVGDTAWLLTATGLVLLMTPGLSFFYAGMVSTKNVISTMLQSFIALGVIAPALGRRRLQPLLRRQLLRPHRRSADLLHVPRRRRRDASRPGADDSARRSSRCSS